MKNILLLIFLLQINLLLAQDSIVSGYHKIDDIYFDYNPDTILSVASTHISLGPGYLALDIDINSDSVIDYQIENQNLYGNTGGGYKVQITPYNNNEINYYRIDSAVSILMDTLTYYIPKPFNYGEVINDTQLYTTSEAYLIKYAWNNLSGYWSHSINDWENIGERYLGIRMPINDTLYYGWIRLNVSYSGSTSQVVVQEYVLSKEIEPSINNISNKHNIQLYPNPAESTLYIKLSELYKSGNIYFIDINGVIHKSQKFSHSDLISINISDLESGVYLLKIIADGNVYCSRIIKQK